MKHLQVRHVLTIHRRVIERTGGDPNVRDEGLLDSAVVQTQWQYYPTIAEKAAALAFSLCKNHPFADGNKRTSFMSMAMFLARNGHEVIGTVDEAEKVFVDLASGTLSRSDFVVWVANHIRRKQ